MTAGTIHTLGDSTLDNVYWMFSSNTDVKTAKLESVEGRLQNLSSSDGYELASHAYDGFTTRSVLEGDTIGAVLPDGPSKDLYLNEKAPQGRKVHPLAELQKKVQASPNARHYVVISVGGNDFRANLKNPCRLLKDIPQIQKRYLQIVDAVKSLKGRDIRPILMFQYRTDAVQDPYRIYSLFTIIGIVAAVAQVAFLALLTAPIWIVAAKISLLAGAIFFITGAAGLYLSHKIVPLSVTKDILSGKTISMTVMNALLKSFYQPILKVAKKERIPILDLPNTFNPNSPLYISGIEPSSEGGRLIAQGIYQIVKCHDFKGPSLLYFKPSQQVLYNTVPNSDPRSWKVS